MDRIVSSRTKRILELVSYDEQLDNLEESEECCKADDVVEIESEEDEEIEVDENIIEDEDEEEIDGDFDSRFTSKDGTFWLKSPFVRRRQRSSNIVRVPAGVSSHVDKQGDILYFFKLFISPDIVDIIVKYTNQRGIWETENHNKNGNGDEREWIDVDQTEIYAFIGLLICAAATKSNHESVSMLWCSDFLFQRPIYTSTMSRNRFSMIFSCMRFDDMLTRNERVSTDKLAAIREINDLFAIYCQMYYNPGTHLTIDERLVPFRGYAPFRVYMKSKPAKYGIKIWVLADCETAYCKNFQVYLGKQDGKPEKNQGQRVVLDMVGILDQGYGITTDNFFTSLELSQKLLEKKLTLCGTVRKTRPSSQKNFCHHGTENYIHQFLGINSRIPWFPTSHIKINAWFYFRPSIIPVK